MSEHRASTENREAEKPRASQSSPDNPPEERRYPIASLIDGARGYLGVSPVAASGAFVGGRKQTYTIAEARELVDEFLTREVTPA